MMKASTLRFALKKMDPSYRAFWEALSEWRDAMSEDDSDREELSFVLDRLAKRKSASLADWETLTMVQTKLKWANEDPRAQKASALLDPMILEISRK
jgi:hypothetical protein